MATGKVSEQSRPSVKSSAPNSRTNRKHIANLQRNKKKDEVLFSKRLGSNAGPPKIVALIALGDAVDLNTARAMLLSGVADASKPGPVTAIFPAFKQRMTLLNVPRDLESVLEAAKVADVILSVINATEMVDDLGRSFISVIKAQGMPSILTAVQGFNQLPAKNKAESKKALKEFVSFHFPEHERLLSFDTPEDAAQVLRFLTNLRIRQLAWRERRAYMLVEGLKFVPNPAERQPAEGVPRGTLSVTGYLRGGSLSASDLIYIPDFGDFKIIQIDGPQDPCPFGRRREVVAGMETENGGASSSSSSSEAHAPTQVLEVADAAKQDSLESEKVPDIMANEQNWGPEDDAELALAEERRRRRVPKGTSAYQAAWIVESDGEEDEEDASEGEGEAVDEEGKGNEGDSDGEAEGTRAAGMAHSDGEEGEDEEEEEYEELQTGEQADDTTTEADGEEVDMQAAEMERERLRQESEDEVKWPDEVQTPSNVKAKIRFRKYRGLKSFRNTPWDPKELLPLDYARIYQFKNFTRSMKKILDEHDGVIVRASPIRNSNAASNSYSQPGTYITIHIADVPQTLRDFVHPARAFVVSGLFRHEHKTSVLHFTALRTASYTEPIRSKDDMIVQCGFRRFRARPFFSQNTANDKHKLERFLHPGNATVATVYGPITLPPAPVLYFRELDPGSVKPVHNLVLVASGSLLSVDPDRIAVKKIVLTGLPYKLHKRSAVIKHMFYFPDDIRWFKPVELWTKYGRAGHITEPLGTHGLMKCRFDGKLLSHDTVCMNLYKRVFPKWATTTLLSEPAAPRPTKTRSVLGEQPSSGASSSTPFLSAEALATLQTLLPQ